MHKAYVSIQTPDHDKCRLLKQFLLLLKTNDFNIRNYSDFYLIQDKDQLFYHNQALIINTNLPFEEFKKILHSLAKFVCKSLRDQIEVEIVSFYDHHSQSQVKLNPKHNLEHYIAFQEIDTKFLMQKAHVSQNQIAPLVMQINSNTIKRILNFIILGLIAIILLNSHMVKAINSPLKTLEIEIADTADLRRQGLANRPNLDHNTGMLFIYTLNQSPQFWTKNMQFPIDIIFLDSDMKVTKIYENALPCQGNPCPIYPGPQNTKFVLELNAYAARQNQIQIGTQLEQKNVLKIYNTPINL